MNEAEPWLNLEQIAAHLAVSKETIYRWLDRQKIPASRVGKLWRFRASEVDEWVSQGGANPSNLEKNNQQLGRKHQ